MKRNFENFFFITLMIYFILSSLFFTYDVKASAVLTDIEKCTVEESTLGINKEEGKVMEYDAARERQKKLIWIV